MKNLLLSLLTAFLIASCGTETDSEFPYRNGTWMVHSPDSADWIGDRPMSKSKSDTVQLRTPQGHHLSVVKAEDKGAFFFNYIDSTATNWQIIDLDATDYIFEDTPIIVDGGLKGVQSDRIRLSLYSFWECGAQVDNQQRFIIQFYQNNGNPYRRYVIHIDGFSDTLNRVAC